MKKYISPKTEITCINTGSILATSLGINDSMGNDEHFSLHNEEILSDNRKIWNNNLWDSQW